MLTALVLAGTALLGLRDSVAQETDAPAAKQKATATKGATAKPESAKAKEPERKASESKNAKAKQPKKKAKEPDSKGTSSKTKDAKSKETKAKDGKSKEAKSKDPKSKGPKTKDAKAAQGPKATAAKASTAKAAATGSVKALTPPAPPAPPPPALALAGSSSTAPAEIEATKQAFNHARAGQTAQATEIQRGIKDATARKLIEWAILRADNNSAGLARYIAFIDDNPDWLTIGVLRRRAEALIWNEQLSANATRAYFSRHPPLTARGRFALARALLAAGDRAGAQTQLRNAWHNDEFSADIENRAIEIFGELLTAEDHRIRMNMRLFANDAEAGLRNAGRIGGHAPAVAKARIASIPKRSNPKAALDTVPAAGRRDPAYLYSLATMHRKARKFAEAGEAMLSLPKESAHLVNGDPWWIEGRLVVRGLLDIGDAKKAYRVAREAPPQKKDIYRSDNQFTAGWIALRFLNDASSAQAHFIRAAEASSNPVHLSRAQYWHGRALDALGRKAEARAQYQAAAQHGTAYYGQIASAKIGAHTVTLRPPPAPPPRPLELVRAIELLYAIGQRDLIAGVLAELGDRLNDASALAAIAEVAIRNNDARAALLVGKGALARGLPLETYAFPTIGLPSYTAVGPAVEKSLLYAIARQESTFNPKVVSHARAMGLMQMTPPTGRIIAKKYNVAWAETKLLTDPAYNVQLGAAELGTLLTDFRGSFILTFVGYNAGRGRVRDWTAAYGDPRDPRVDPVDWVERIPIAETRFYIQRVMENMQVYRARFGGGTKLTIEADMRTGTSAN